MSEQCRRGQPPRLLLGSRGGRDHVRRRRHVRRGAGAARHDDDGRVPIDQLQRAAPIVSGFLLGYVAMLPLIGRIADLRGRVPVLGPPGRVRRRVARHGARLRPAQRWSPAGSSRASAAAGSSRPPWRWWPTCTRSSAAACRSGSSAPSRRSAACSGRSSGRRPVRSGRWRAIFWLNFAVGLVLAAVVRCCGGATPSRRPGPVALAGSSDYTPRDADVPTCWAGSRPRSCSGAGLVFVQPAQLKRDLTWGHSSRSSARAAG